jgi:hypothetical protein
VRGVSKAEGFSRSLSRLRVRALSIHENTVRPHDELFVFFAFLCG